MGCCFRQRHYAQYSPLMEVCPAWLLLLTTGLTWSRLEGVVGVMESFRVSVNVGHDAPCVRGTENPEERQDSTNIDTSEHAASGSKWINPGRDVGHSSLEVVTTAVHPVHHHQYNVRHLPSMGAILRVCPLLDVDVLTLASLVSLVLCVS